jgi:preprotein translocase subunit SecE
VFNPIQFLKEAKIELKKVTWPTRKEAIRLTEVVLIVSLIVMVYLGALDYLFNQVVKIFL